MGTISKVKVGTTTHNVASSAFVVCGTAAATAAKVTDSFDFPLVEGAIINVKFTNGNTAASPTLKIGSSGTAKSIISNYSFIWSAGVTLSFTYTSSGFILNDRDTHYSINTPTTTALGNSTNSDYKLVVPTTIVSACTISETTSS